MTSADYVDTYLGFWCWVGDTFTVARVRNYLEGVHSSQLAHAQKARTDLLSGIQKLIGKFPGPTFEVQGDQYVMTSIDRVFMGKGAPDEIQNVIWLASLCGLVDTTTLAGYCDQNLGVDCGGFVANYWGLGHPLTTAARVDGDTGISPRTFWVTNQTMRRKAASEIRVDDAAIFFEDVKSNNPDVVATKKSDGKYDTATGSQAFHIGLVASISTVVSDSGSPSAGPVRVKLEIAESSGSPSSTSGGNGVRIRSLGTVAATVANNLVYCPDGANRIYFVGRTQVSPPYMPNNFGAA
jgi:hypothetical protein